MLPLNTSSIIEAKGLPMYNASELIDIFNISIELLEPAEYMMRSLMEIEEDINSRKGLGCLSMLVLGIVAIPFCWGLFAATMSASSIWDFIGYILICVIMFVLPGGILAFLFHLPRKIKRKKLENEFNELMNSLIFYTERTLLNSPANIFPAVYRHYDTLKAMRGYLCNYEATNWQECTALWKEDLHRAEIEKNVKATRTFSEKAAEDAATAAFFSFWR